MIICEPSVSACCAANCAPCGGAAVVLHQQLDVGIVELGDARVRQRCASTAPTCPALPSVLSGRISAILVWPVPIADRLLPGAGSGALAPLPNRSPGEKFEPDPVQPASAGASSEARRAAHAAATARTLWRWDYDPSNSFSRRRHSREIRKGKPQSPPQPFPPDDPDANRVGPHSDILSAND